MTDSGLPDTDRADLEKMFQRAGVEYEDVYVDINIDEIRRVVMDRYSELVATAIVVRSGGSVAGGDGLATVYAFDVQGALIDTWAWDV